MRQTEAQLKQTEAHTGEPKRKARLLFKRMQIVIIVLMMLALVLYRFQRSVTYEKQNVRMELLSQESLDAAARLTQEPECLLLWDNTYQAQIARDMMQDVLGQMRVPYQSHPAAEEEAGALDQYKSIVLCLSDYNALGAGVWTLLDWVRDGGSLMLTFLPDYSVSFNLIRENLGILSVSNHAERVEGLHFSKPLMLGGGARDFGIMDAYDSSVRVLLDDACEVFMESSGDNPLPLIWRREVENGCMAAVNLNFFDKAYRGLYAAAYSLLDEAFVWPVINGSAFYLDDFPSPVPGGEGDYIRRDFNMTIEDFYTHVWWVDVQKLAKDHGIRFTGLVIEEYSDQVEGTLPPNTDITRYQYFGNTLLNAGGEIGFHGYNHMPLVLENFDYLGEYDSYKCWTSYDEMRASIAELNRFCASLYPKEQFAVYVPPSNILSEEGRQMLAKEFPNIRAIASTYLDDSAVYVQEFEVADDGVIETPRVVSGYIMNDYTRLVAMTELTMHYVNTHFQHPDDVLDPDRGAELGWTEMIRRLTDYADWLYAAAPDIRNLTGIEMAAAVQRYDALQVEQRVEDDTLRVDLGGFVDEAYLLMRLNGKTPGQAQGGELEKLLDNLYLLHANDAHVEIELR